MKEHKREMSLLKAFLKSVFVLLLTAAMLLAVGCKNGSGSAESEGEIAITDPLLLGSSPAPDNARVFYEIFVGSFSDSDGD